MPLPLLARQQSNWGRDRTSWMNWRVLVVVAIVAVVTLSTLSNNWERQRFSTNHLKSSSSKSRKESLDAARSKDKVKTPQPSVDQQQQEAEKELQELKSSIENPQGTKGAAKDDADDDVDEYGLEYDDDLAEAAIRGAQPSPPPPQSPSPSPSPSPPPPSPSPPPPAPPPPSTPPNREPGSCFLDQPWIPPALDSFFQHTWRSANASTQSSRQALDAINKIRWNKYTPGHDEVTLRYDEGEGRYVMDVKEIGKPNLAYKKECILSILKGAVEAHQEELVQVLGKRALTFVVVTEDFGLVWRGQKWKLPTFSLCTDDNMIDIPVPDFTYACYPETRYRNTSWPAIRDLLYQKSQMVAWGDRRNRIFQRGHWGVGVRKKLMPLFNSYQNSSRDVEAFGAKLDVSDSGFSPHHGPRRDNYVWLDNQCDNRYQIHTAGFSYSAGLKYKLACGSMVFKFDSSFKEFYEPALQDGVHVVKVSEDTAKFESETVPKIKEAVEQSQEKWPSVAQRGQEFVMKNLTMEALHCYWYGALVRYSELYFLEKTPAQLEAERKAREEAEAAAQKLAGQEGEGKAGAGGGGNRGDGGAQQGEGSAAQQAMEEKTQQEDRDAQQAQQGQQPDENT